MAIDLLDKTILLVDDEEANLLVLRGILERAGYRRVETLDDSRLVIERFLDVEPDLLVVDFRMPYLDGLDVLKALSAYLTAYFPVLMVTADDRPELRQKALAGGAKDFLPKPFDAVEVQLRIRNLLEARHFHTELQRTNEQLEATVRSRTAQLEQAHIEMSIRLARAAEYRDDESGEHVWRVARTSALLGEQLGLDAMRVQLLLRAARLHDVGKIAIPDGILLKPGRLSDPEFDLVRQHTLVGAKLLSGGQSPLMQMAETIALTHHERWDGTGYPQGLVGDEIPLEGRILAVADTFDALTHDRIHRRAVSPREAVAEIARWRGSQFDPVVVDAFLALYERGDLQVDPPVPTA